MDTLKKEIKFLYLNNIRTYKNMVVIWLIFLISVIATSIFKLPNVAFAMAIGLISSAVTFIIIQPFVNQLIVFPYSVNLGFKRTEYLWGILIFNILTSLFLMICIYGLSIILNLLGVGYSPVNFPSIRQAVSFALISIGLTGITTLVSLVFYRFKFFYGLAFLLLALSPFMFFRYQIIDMLQWQTGALFASSVIFLAFGTIAALLSNVIIKKTEVR